MAPGTATRFSIEAKVAVGGMGVVYRARDSQTGALVALKQLAESDRETLQRFSREAQVLAAMDHPAVVRYIAHGMTEEGQPYLAMEWVDGETLHQRIDRAGLTVAESIALARRLASGLAHAHSRSVVHRDVKPCNVILRGDSLADAVIVDFGIARASGGLGSLTATGALVGTPSYMSPEQARGERNIDARADMFALGCVLYECLSGAKVFEGKHALALIAKVVLWDPIPLTAVNPHVPPAVDALVRRMLAKQPALRPDDAEIEGLLVGLDLTGVSTEAAPARQMTAAKAREVTARIPARPRTTLALVTTAEGADGSAPSLAPDALESRRTDVARSVGGREVRVEILQDGSVVAIAPVTMAPEPAAYLALDTARALGAALPDALVGLTTGEVDSLTPGGGGDALEQTVASLAKEAMTRMFARGPADGGSGLIRLDAATEQLLRAEPLVKLAGVAYAPGAR